MDEVELGRLQDGAHASLLAATYSPKHVLPSGAAAVILATVSLVDEVRRLREALRLACQDLRGPGVPTDDLVADYLRAAETAP